MKMVRGSSMRKTRLMLLQLIVVVVLIASQAVASRTGGVGTELFSCGDDNNPEIKCLYRCLVPGLCNKCCKKSGFTSGKCVQGGCYCCTT